MLFLDGVYAEKEDGKLRFHRVKAPNVDELKALVHAISHRVARFLEKRGYLERDADDCMDAEQRMEQLPRAAYLALEPDDDDAMAQLQGQPYCREHFLVPTAAATQQFLRSKFQEANRKMEAT